jgi:hypothetical protein
MKSQSKNLMVLSLSALLLMACEKSSVASSETSVASTENSKIRSSNCALIDSWMQYVDDPSMEDFWGNQNTYGYYAEEENTLWRNLQQGDRSYELLLELRKVSYAQDWWDAPQLGTIATEENVVRLNENPFSDDQEWSIIRDVSNTCTNYTDEKLANYFARALLLK